MTAAGGWRPIETGKELAPAKPEYGAPCNGCGFCCAAELCHAAEMVLGPGPGPCPLLSFHDNRFWCSLVETEQSNALEPILTNALGIGSGCDVEDIPPPPEDQP